MPGPEPSAVVDFYDGLSPDYDLVYGDAWDDAVAGQGAALDGLIRGARPAARDVLDCSCGIGTQAIGLALRSYRVTGTDISERSIERAGAEARRLGADARRQRPRLRRGARRPAGHGAADRDHRATAPAPRANARLGPAGEPAHTVRVFVLTETEAGWTMAHHGTRYRAITREALARAAAEAGLRDVAWHTADSVGYHQPLMTATT